MFLKRAPSRSRRSPGAAGFFRWKKPAKRGTSLCKNQSEQPDRSVAADVCRAADRPVPAECGKRVEKTSAAGADFSLEPNKRRGADLRAAHTGDLQHGNNDQPTTFPQSGPSWKSFPHSDLPRGADGFPQSRGSLYYPY
jgi:hypothetical protein